MEMPLKVDAQLPLSVTCFFSYCCGVVRFMRFYCALKPSVVLAVTVGTNVSHSVYNQILPKIYAPKKATDRLKRELIWTLDVPEHFNLLYPFFFLYATKRLCTFEYDGSLVLAPFEI